MLKADFIFFDAGGGHRAAATALKQVVEQHYPWEVRLVNLQEVLDPLDLMRKTIGVRIQDVYNYLLRHSLTWGSKHLLPLLQATIRLYHRQEVQLLEARWRKTQPDLVVSLVPHFNRALFEAARRAAPAAPFVTVLTDLADYPPHFWIENQDQHFVCGTARAVSQAKSLGIPPQRIHLTSGMILHPRFYQPVAVERHCERTRLGLDPNLPTGLVLFGGYGSRAMVEIVRRLDASHLDLQLILICGRNQQLAEQLRRLPGRLPRFVEGFTTDIPYYMHLADFFIGKPGPASISEAIQMKLPVIVERNAATMPQERYNTEWIVEKQVGVVVRSFRQIRYAVGELLSPSKLALLRANTTAIQNRAVFEIPSILEHILLGIQPS